jgi:hypothetical protein
MVSPTVNAPVASEDFTSVIDGCGDGIVTAAELVRGLVAPLLSVTLAVAVFVIVPSPASISACITVYVAVQVKLVFTVVGSDTETPSAVQLPTAPNVPVPLNELPSVLSRLPFSSMEFTVMGELLPPELFIVKVYVTGGSPTVAVAGETVFLNPTAPAVKIAVKTAGGAGTVTPFIVKLVEPFV